MSGRPFASKSLQFIMWLTQTSALSCRTRKSNEKETGDGGDKRRVHELKMSYLMSETELFTMHKII